MNETIIKNWNSMITEEDDVYILGDIMLGNNEVGLKMLKQLRGNIHIIIGNHDTDIRVKLYEDCYNVVEITYATIIKYNGYSFYLSHYPTMTSNLEKEFGKHCLLCLSGHTHSKEKFYNGLPFVYNVALDAHNNKPISAEDVLNDIKKEVQKCKSYL